MPKSISMSYKEENEENREPQLEIKIAPVKFIKSEDLYDSDATETTTDAEEESETIESEVAIAYVDMPMEESNEGEGGEKESDAPELSTQDRFKCNSCDRDYANKANLDRHFVSQHIPKTAPVLREMQERSCKKPRNDARDDDIRPLMEDSTQRFVCGIKKCGRTFKKEYYLKEHQILHNNSKRLRCEKCNHTFTEKGSLKRHERNPPKTCPRNKLAR